jgi:hypothetical protein
MKTKLPMLVAALLIAILDSQFSTVVAQGALTPSGAPAPLFKTLQQVEPRTAITNTGAVTIAASGSYYLATNIIVASGDAVTITADNVTLDLNGFTISSTAPGGSGSGVLLSGGRRNIAIRNGQIEGDPASANGFQNGIMWSTSEPRNVRVTDLAVSGCSLHGIQLGDDFSTVVEGCTVHTVGAEGIRAGIINRCTALQCGASAIVGVNATDCYGSSTASFGLTVTKAANCSGTSAGGTGIFAFTAQNCYGASTGGGTGHGINAYQAVNCWGSAAGSGHGIFGVSVNNCRGQASSGDGIVADDAANSYGSSSFGSGSGVNASTAINCRGLSSQTGYGLVTYVAFNCFGESTSGNGISALVASYCYGVSGSGYGVYANIATGCYGSSSTSPGLRFLYAGAMCYGHRNSPSGSATVLGAGSSGPVNLPP